MIELNKPNIEDIYDLFFGLHKSSKTDFAHHIKITLFNAKDKWNS